MKKRERLRKDGNVVFFPDIEMRLFEKGLDMLQRKKFREAIPFFEEARELEPDNSDVLFALVLAYYEAGVLKNARMLAEEMLKKGIGDYFETIDMLIMILVQLKDYHEVVQTIEVLLEEQEIPVEKYEHFKRILEFSRRMADASVNQQEEVRIEPEYEDDPLQSLNLFSDENSQDLLLRIANLANQNIQPVKAEIYAYLQSDEGQPFLKTMLLHVLKEHGIEQPVLISKLGQSLQVTPKELVDLRDHLQKKEIGKLLSKQLEHENPVLLEHALSLVDRHFFIIYPFDLPSANVFALAAAYHTLVVQYSGQVDSYEDINDNYKAEKSEVEKLIRYIQGIEEFSYPII